MAAPITRRGLVDELFELLCHPNLIALIVIALTLTTLGGLPTYHPLSHALLVGLISALVARSALYSSWASLSGVVGLALVLTNLARDHRAGELEVTSWRSASDTVESYQRGDRVKVKQHLKDEFKLKATTTRTTSKTAPQGAVVVSLGEEKLTLDYQRFVRREVFELGKWRFHYLKSEDAPDQIKLKLKFVHRETQRESVLTLERGQMDHIDQGPSRRMVVQVAQLRAQSSTEPYTQVALNAQWLDEKTGKPVEPRRIVLRSDVPDYDKSFGVSPYVVSIERVERSPVQRFRLAVRERPDYRFAWFGVALMIFGLGSLLTQRD